MKVITFDNSRLDDACRELEAQIVDFEPDLILGIANGGIYVSERIFSSVLHAQITCQRKSTANKKSRLLGILLSNLPLCLLDLLRKWESLLLGVKKKTLSDVSIPETLVSSILKSKRILVVDDAVDSGATMLSVVNSLKKFTKALVKTAVITVTTSNPLIAIDYKLYNNRTLIRFPWALDAKRK